MFERINTVPVFLAGMWPSFPGKPESGTRVSFIEKVGSPALLEGFSDTFGDFRGRLPVSWVGKEVYVVVLEPGFKYDYFNPLKVERWGLFLAIRQEKDLNYIGSKGAKSVDPDGFDNWNPTQEHIRASQKISEAVRNAKITWPLRPVGLVVAIILGIGGFFFHPLVGFILGVLSFVAMELLAQSLLNRGY